MLELVDLWLIPVIIMLNILATVIIARKYLNILAPDLDHVISRGMSALGSKSGDVRSERAMEKAITTDMLSQYPEVMALLEHFSPETVDMIKKNPQMALNLIERYKPMIDKFMPMLTGEKQGEQPGKYDL